MVKPIKKIPQVYLWYFSVLIISFLLAWTLPTPDIFKGIASIPGVGSMILILVQLWRDDRAHGRTLEIQQKEQIFALGTTSHMANVAYDKHVLFCEDYIKRVQEILQELLRDGPTKKALNHGADLVNIRIKHSAWLTREIEEKLKPFEMALIKMGAEEHLLESLPMGERRNKAVEEVFRFFSLIVGDEKPTSEEEKDVARDMVIESIREILGINTLTALRKDAAELALERIQRPTPPSSNTV